MTQALPAFVNEYLATADSEEDLVITEVSRVHASAEDRQRLEKWKQNLRIQLIREKFEAQKKEDACHPSILHRLLNFPGAH